MTKVENFKFWCQKVLPLVYDDSLSYYEVLCKAINYINNLIENEKEIEQTLEKHETSIDELKFIVDVLEKEITEVISGESTGILITPSGDTTGTKDKINIQTALNYKHNVRLIKGMYYINDSIEVVGGDILMGVDNVSTIVNVVNNVSAIKGKENTSVDHIIIANMQIKNNLSGSTKPCIDLLYPYTANFLGARYSLFKDLWIRNFQIGIDCSVMWDTRFINCRLDNNTIGINIGNSCNNITFDNCQFYGNDITPRTYIGVKSTSRNNTENYNYSFNNCDFEKLLYGCDLTVTIGCSFYGCYFEKVTNGIKMDSCPSSIVNGGNFNGVEKVARVNKTYSSNVFNGSYEFSDFFADVTSDTDTEIIVVSNDVGRVYCHNISIYNRGNGMVTYTNNDKSTYRCNVTAKACHEYSTGRLRYSSDSKTIKFNNVATNEQVKLQNIYLTVLNETVTTINNVTIDVYDSDNVKVAVGNLDIGTYTKGQIITISPIGTIIKDMDKNLFTIKPSGDCGIDITFDIESTAYVGEFKTPKAFLAPAL